MKKIFFALAVLTAFALIATSCSDDKTTSEEKIPVSGVTVTPATGSVVVGTTLTLEAKVLPENATVKTVEWISRTPELASVDKTSGVVTGLAVGDAEIWALCDGKNAKAIITVTAAPIRVESVALSKETMPLFVGKSEVLTAVVTPDNATDKTVVWASSDPAVATVAENGTVTAVAVGTATITATADEKSATCEVTVSIADISDITMTNIDAGSTITMTATGFLEGDKVRLEALVGDATAEVAIKNVTAANAQFDLPAACTADRSYKVTVMRGAAAKAEAFLRPNNEMVRLPYAVGYFMTGDNEVVPNDPTLGINGKKRMGYAPGKIFAQDEMTKEFIVWKADATAVGPLALEENNGIIGGPNVFDFTYVTGIENLDPLKGLFNMSNVKALMLADSSIKSLDVTIFPDATKLYMWGTVGVTNKLESINFGSYTDDAHACKLELIQIERQALKGTIDLRNCIYLTGNLSLDDNALTGINLGIANGNSATDDRMIPVASISAKNNQLKEFDISNCGRVRKLFLDGNKIERIRLLNNALGDGMNSGRPDEYFPYTYIFKSPDCLSITWATAAEAEGRERVIDVERYWWRVFSSGNSGENTANGLKDFEGGWLAGNPVTKALADGFKVNCWNYWHENGSNDPGPMGGDHNHAGGSEPCAY